MNMPNSYPTFMQENLCGSLIKSLCFIIKYLVKNLALLLLLLFFKDFIYLFERKRACTGAEVKGEREREREKQTPR